MRGCFFQLLLLFLLIQTSFAQKEGNIWYFGNYAGIDFSKGEAKPITNSKLSTTEGCASISDKQGKLLFYTDGITLWNKAHKVMADGTNLMGDPSSTQSAVIVPKPASATEYYVFTVDNVGQLDGFRYSVVDMAKENGHGKVTIKNEAVVTPVTEKLTALAHKNGKDIWVIVHGWNSNSFYAYLITDQGFNKNPVISNTGTVHSGRDNNTIGNMKASPDGSKLALAVRGLKLYELFDFNNATGAVSNPVVFQSNDYNSAYGLEFSPDGSKLYINSSQNPTAKIYQVDLTNNYTTTLVGTSASAYAGSLQLAPDGKIYFSRYQSAYMGIIDHPNEPGVSSNYVDDGLYLDEKRTTFGLPNFVQSWFYQPTFTFSGACYSEPTFFSITDTTNIRKVQWIFDDPVVDVVNESARKDPAHIFSNPGQYEILLYITYRNGRQKRASRMVTIPSPPVISLGEDKVLCKGETYTLGAGLPRGGIYEWQDGSTEATLVVNKPGIYWVDAIIDGCPARDSVIISYTKPISVELDKDTLLCSGNSLLLKAQPMADATYLWQDGSTDASFIADKPGTYWVQVSNTCETVKDSIRVNFAQPLPEVYLDKNRFLAPDESLIVQADIPNTTCSWQNGSTETSFKISAPGIYWVDISNGCQTRRDSIVISAYIPVKLNLGKDTTLCQGSTMQLNVFSSGATYLWQDGSTDASFMASKPGTYWVQVSNGYEMVADSIKITYKPSLRVDLGENTALCGQEQIVLVAKQTDTDATYLWQDGSTDASFIADKPGTYWVQVSNACETVKDSVTIYCPECTLEEIPNVITPNNDGMNDSFEFACMKEQIWQIGVYNRWGKLVYQSNHYLGGWDAANLENGIYYYTLKTKTSPTTVKGTIHVLR